MIKFNWPLSFHNKHNSYRVLRCRSVCVCVLIPTSPPSTGERKISDSILFGVRLISSPSVLNRELLLCVQKFVKQVFEAAKVNHEDGVTEDLMCLWMISFVHLTHNGNAQISLRVSDSQLYTIRPTANINMCAWAPRQLFFLSTYIYF